MLGRTTGPYPAASESAREIGQLLPETRHVLEAVEAAETMYDLDRSDLEEHCQIASYRVHPQADLPPSKFYIVGANEHLLALAGKEIPGFEVLQIHCAGLEYHWRSDLVRAFEEQVTLVSRFYGLAGRSELVMEHLAVPIYRKHRVREIWGWFAGDQDLRQVSEAVRLGELPVFRRSERAQPVQLSSGAMQRN